jgi:hypothetical protein
MKKKLLILNYISSVSIIVCNVFEFIPLSIKILRTDGGPMGFGYNALPFLLILHLFIIFGVHFLISIKEKSFLYTLINLILSSISILLMINLRT